MKVKCNGVELNYVKSGSGQPLILLHGNGEDHSVFDDFLPYVRDEFTVYAVDSRSHGDSSKAALGYRAMAEDIASFIETSGIAEPIVAGFSDGGIIALLLAASHRVKLKGIVAMGANSAPCGIKRFWRILFRTGYLFTRSEYLKLMIYEPDITVDELGSIDVPALLTVGERDMIYPAHVKAIAERIVGAELKVVAGANHVSYVTDGAKLYSVIGDFISSRR